MASLLKRKPPEPIRVDVDVRHHFDSGLVSQLLSIFSQINRKVTLIMANVSDLPARLAALEASLTGISDNVDKVSGETAALILEVSELRDALSNTPLPPEAETALAAVETRAANLAAKVKAVDDQVADVSTP